MSAVAGSGDGTSSSRGNGAGMRGGEGQAVAGCPRKPEEPQRSGRKRPRVVAEGSAGGEEDRTRFLRKWLAVAVQRAAASLPGRSGAQRARGRSQALPHRVCATHGWSVRREERPRSRPRATWPAGLRRAHGADSTYPLQGPVTSRGRPPTAGEQPLITWAAITLMTRHLTRLVISRRRGRGRREAVGSVCRRSRGSPADLKPYQTSITASHWAQTSRAYFGVYHDEPGCSEGFQDAASMANVS
jgi:hypothetical protein